MASSYSKVVLLYLLFWPPFSSGVTPTKQNQFIYTLLVSKKLRFHSNVRYPFQSSLLSVTTTATTTLLLLPIIESNTKYNSSCEWLPGLAPKKGLSSSRFQKTFGVGYPLTEQTNCPDWPSRIEMSPEHCSSLKLGGSENQVLISFIVVYVC